jgi:hypothetical protein
MQNRFKEIIKSSIKNAIKDILVKIIIKPINSNYDKFNDLWIQYTAVNFFESFNRR